MREPWQTMLVFGLYELVAVLVLVIWAFPATLSFLGPIVVDCLIIGLIWAYFVNEYADLDPTWQMNKKTGIRYRLIRCNGTFAIEYNALDTIMSAPFQKHIKDLKRLEAAGLIGPTKPSFEYGGVEQ